MQDNYASVCWIDQGVFVPTNRFRKLDELAELLLKAKTAG
jgi:hypothetical protein